LGLGCVETAADCPGVKGLDAASMAKLRKWAAEAENKTKQMAK